jgi:hypothetical protein
MGFAHRTRDAVLQWSFGGSSIIAIVPMIGIFGAEAVVPRQLNERGLSSFH